VGAWRLQIAAGDCLNVVGNFGWLFDRASSLTDPHISRHALASGSVRRRPHEPGLAPQADTTNAGTTQRLLPFPGGTEMRIAYMV
jgi:hypothetical protein